MQEKSKQTTGKSNYPYIPLNLINIQGLRGSFLQYILKGNQRRLNDCLVALDYLENPESFVLAVGLDPELKCFSLRLAFRIFQIVTIVGISKWAGGAKSVLREAGLERFIPEESKRKHERNYLMAYLRDNPDSLKGVVQSLVERLRKKPYQSREETEKAVDDLFRASFGRPMPLGFLSHLDNENYDKGLKVIALKIYAYERHLPFGSLIDLWKRPERKKKLHHSLNVEMDTPEMLLCLDAFSKVLGLNLVPPRGVIPHWTETEENF